MKLIGYWMADLREGHLPLPQELVGTMPEALRDGVCGYLANGRILRRLRGQTWCRFRCGISAAELGPAEYTDGEWAWPEGLAHYVRAHQVILPEDFIATATSGRLPKKGLHHRSASLEYWIEWARPHQSRPLRQRLAEALMAAQVAEAALIAGIVRDGATGGEPCQASGCTRPALIGRRFCDQHIQSDEQVRAAITQLYQLPDPLPDHR